MEMKRRSCQIYILCYVFGFDILLQTLHIVVSGVYRAIPSIFLSLIFFIKMFYFVTKILVLTIKMIQL